VADVAEWTNEGAGAGALAALREHVGELQLPQIAHGRRAIILFEGLQGSAKKFALKQLISAFDPCHCQVYPTAFDRREGSEGHWLARFWRQLPSAGNTAILFKRGSRRVLDARVLGRTAEDAIPRTLDEINEFEAQQRDHGTMIAKLFFHITPERQAANLRARMEDPWLRHLRDYQPIVGPANRDRANEVLQDFFAHTNTRWAPWTVIDANDDTASCITALTAIADQMEKVMPSEPPAMGETIVPFRSPKTPESTSA